MSAESEHLKVLYGNRFGSEGIQRADLWEVLCRDFFQRWVPRDATVLDVAAGHCEFINNIEAGRRIAVDLNPDVTRARGCGRRGARRRSDDDDDIATSSWTGSSSATSSSTSLVR